MLKTIEKLKQSTPSSLRSKTPIPFPKDTRTYKKIIFSNTMRKYNSFADAIEMETKRFLTVSGFRKRTELQLYANKNNKRQLHAIK